MKKNPMYTRVEKKILSMPAAELRLTAHLAREELDMRRACWVNEMCEQFSEKERIGMAFAIQGSAPYNTWERDRVIVNCFTDKSRSKVVTGMSRLSPDDFYDYNTGVAIAFARAMGKPVPDLF